MKKHIVFYILSMTILCLAFLCLEIHLDYISNIFVSGKKYFYLIKHIKFWRKISNYILICLTVTPIIFMIIAIKKTSKEKDKSPIRSFFITTFIYSVVIYLIHIALVNIFDINYFTELKPAFMQSYIYIIIIHLCIKLRTNRLFLYRQK